jgi:hypothetical protein
MNGSQSGRDERLSLGEQQLIRRRAGILSLSPEWHEPRPTTASSEPSSISEKELLLSTPIDLEWFRRGLARLTILLLDEYMALAVEAREMENRRAAVKKEYGRVCNSRIGSNIHTY